MSERHRADAAFALAVLFGVGLLFAVGVVDRRDALLGHSDFSYIWAGPRTILDGGDPYDPASWSASVARLDTEPFADPAVYSYPPHVAIALLPLGALPLPVAAFVWAWGGLALAAIAMWRLLRAFVPERPVAYAAAGLALTISEPAVISFSSGQWSHVLLAAGAGLAIAVARPRVHGGGMLAAALTAKPQLFAVTTLAFAVAAAARGHRGLAWSIVAAAIAPPAIAFVVRPGWFVGWAAGVPVVRSLEPNITTLVAATRGLGTVGLVLTGLVIAAGAVIALASGPRTTAWLALWMAFGVMAAPYARSYDHLVLLVPAVIAAGRLGDRAADLGILVMALVQIGGSWAMLVIVAPPRESESLSVVIAVAGFALVAALAFAGRRRDDPAG